MIGHILFAFASIIFLLSTYGAYLLIEMRPLGRHDVPKIYFVISMFVISIFLAIMGAGS